VSGAVGHAQGLVRAGIGGVEIAELGQGEGEPTARRHIGDGGLIGGGASGHGQRVHVLAQDQLGATVLPLRVTGQAEIAAGEGLEGQVLGRVRDAETTLAVLNGEIGLAIQIVVVDEVAVHPAEARLVAELCPQVLGFLGELEHVAQPPELEQRRPELEPDVDGLLELGPTLREMGQRLKGLIEE